MCADFVPPWVAFTIKEAECRNDSTEPRGFPDTTVHPPEIINGHIQFNVGGRLAREGLSTVFRRPNLLNNRLAIHL